MRSKPLHFNLREFAGSMGDFGTLFPFAIGYIAINELNPAGFLVMMGIANIATGLVYRLPLPIEPMKVLAAMAIAQHWSPSMIYASGFAMGIVWLLFTFTGIVDLIARITPKSVIWGIQVSLGLLLATEALKMISTGWIIGIVAVIIVVTLKNNRRAPAAVVLMVLGLVMVILQGDLPEGQVLGFTVPSITSFAWSEVWKTLVLAGFAQIPLTATNAVIATAALIKQYWPDQDVPERQLSLNMGIMNAIFPFFGGMPLCHGAGGLAGQYYFGARSGGANIIEGLIEITFGLFLATSIVQIFSAFPSAIIAAMMLLAGVQLTKFAREVRFTTQFIPMAVTVLMSLVTNMAVGFVAGIALHHAINFNGIRQTRTSSR